ncbi:MAG: hypothetical protein HQK50_16775 [Oligoflexia bacterium]|nr:hypothetical protein [Oligoflexia bacterium]
MAKKLKAQILELEQGTNHYLSEQECSLITIPGIYLCWIRSMIRWLKHASPRIFSPTWMRQPPYFLV